MSFIKKKNWHLKIAFLFVENMKKVYLAIYNLFQFVGFSYIMIVMSVRYYKSGPGKINSRNNCSALTKHQSANNLELWTKFKSPTKTNTF